MFRLKRHVALNAGFACLASLSLAGCVTQMDEIDQSDTRTPLLEARVSHLPIRPRSKIVQSPSEENLRQALAIAGVDHFQFVADCAVGRDGVISSCGRFSVEPETANVRKAAETLYRGFAIVREGAPLKTSVTLSVDARFEGVNSIERCVAVLLCGIPTPPAPKPPEPQRQQ
ncbi:hypothetical protein [Qipengyuania sp. 902]|uniref:hypothetical protein n=1 Tax=Qipengyuania sp. 902 TaxID=3417565 RepID=UPI003EBAC4A3